MTVTDWLYVCMVQLSSKNTAITLLKRHTREKCHDLNFSQQLHSKWLSHSTVTQHALHALWCRLRRKMSRELSRENVPDGIWKISTVCLGRKCPVGKMPGNIWDIWKYLKMPGNIWDIWKYLKMPENIWDIWISMQDYKSLCAAAMICTTLVNTQTHRLLFTSCTISSSSWVD